jgi:uncharacterized protein YeaO (DUF488 family)
VHPHERQGVLRRNARDRRPAAGHPHFALGMRIQTKRVYEQPDQSDGRRILVDRLWPRGRSKAVAKVDFWARAVAPSNALRRWYHHDRAKWDEFRQRYFAELKANPAGLAELRAQLGRGTVTLLYGSKETRFNNATALREYLVSHRQAARGPTGS